MGVIEWLLITLVVGAGIIYFVVRFLYPRKWTGFGSYVTKTTTTEKYDSATGAWVETERTKEKLTERTLWDWIGVAIVSMAVVGFGTLYSYQQSQLQQWSEDQRADAESLQSYLGQMGTLLIDADLRTTEDLDVRNLARARTLTTLDGLDPERKRRVLRYLTETGLVSAPLPEGQTLVSDCSQDSPPVIPQDKAPVISLMYARLDGIGISRHGLLGGIDLPQADLANAALTDAGLSNTSLRGANLFEADLTSADLTGTDLRGACLHGAILTDADLTGADLTGADVTRKQLEQAASLEGVTMPDGSK